MKTTGYKKYIKIATIVSLFSLPFILTNCQEVMKDFTLRDTKPKLVIEGECSTYKDSAIVLISKTANYMTPIEFPKISGAIVTLQFNDTTITLLEEKPGRYGAKYNFPEETNYNLTVTVEGKTYKATSYLPKKVSLTSLSYSISPYGKYSEEYHGQDLFGPKIEMLDPQNVENFYRIKVSKNDTLFNSTAYDIIVTDDLYFGPDTIPYEPQYLYEKNDTILIELQSIDKANYKYYNTLILAINGSGSFSVPDNPATNFDDKKILGHFIAYSSDTLQAIVK
jgi:hypothetical protein